MGLSIQLEMTQEENSFLRKRSKQLEYDLQTLTDKLRESTRERSLSEKEIIRVTRLVDNEKKNVLSEKRKVEGLLEKTRVMAQKLSLVKANEKKLRDASVAELKVKE